MSIVPTLIDATKAYALDRLNSALNLPVCDSIMQWSQTGECVRTWCASQSDTWGGVAACSPTPTASTVTWEVRTKTAHATIIVYWLGSDGVVKSSGRRVYLKKDGFLWAVTGASKVDVQDNPLLAVIGGVLS